MLSSDLRVLFVGDVFGSSGRRVLKKFLGKVVEDEGVDFIIVNAENAAGGRGLTPLIAEEFFSLGVDVLTTGNHVFDQRDIFLRLQDDPRILRPGNFSSRAPGRGCGSFSVKGGKGQIGVLNLQGRVYMPYHTDCPFEKADSSLKGMGSDFPVVIDFHAEATSEKQAMAFYLDGRVSAVIGTHTHVQTADAVILPKKTAFITDVGMTGPIHSVIGMRADRVVERFITGLPAKFEPARGNGVFCAVLIDIGKDGRGHGISTIRLEEESGVSG
jgi:metallophosphoesterase (TIGR00282 family)